MTLPPNPMEIIFNKISRFFKGRFELAVLDEKAGRWFVKPEPKAIPYLKAENANGRHILVKPSHFIDPCYLLVDDLDADQVTCHHKTPASVFKPGRMAVETSPGNFQVWIHSSRPLDLIEKRYWLEKMHNDPGADPNNRWGRCPGFRNRKQKHITASGQYPLARLIWVDWKRQADIPEVLSSKTEKKCFSHQPRGGVCHKETIARSDYEKSDESATDFAYVLALYRRGVAEEEIARRVIAERKDWQNHATARKRNLYLNRTLANAREIIGHTHNK